MIEERLLKQMLDLKRSFIPQNAIFSLNLRNSEDSLHLSVIVEQITNLQWIAISWKIPKIILLQNLRLLLLSIYLPLTKMFYIA